MNRPQLFFMRIESIGTASSTTRKFLIFLILRPGKLTNIDGGAMCKSQVDDFVELCQYSVLVAPGIRGSLSVTGVPWIS